MNHGGVVSLLGANSWSLAQEPEESFLDASEAGVQMADTLVVGLASWIIQDGNYGDFARDTTAAFALEFYASSPPEVLESNSKRAPDLIHVRDADYEIIGQVIHAAEHWWVIDVGVLVFQEAEPPATVRQGSWLRGKISIGIDPFFYFERRINRARLHRFTTGRSSGSRCKPRRSLRSGRGYWSATQRNLAGKMS